MENLDLTQFGNAAETAANAYMLETISGIIFGIIFLIFIFKVFND